MTYIVALRLQSACSPRRQRLCFERGPKATSSNNQHVQTGNPYMLLSSGCPTVSPASSPREPGSMERWSSWSHRVQKETPGQWGASSPVHFPATGDLSRPSSWRGIGLYWISSPGEQGCAAVSRVLPNVDAVSTCAAILTIADMAGREGSLPGNELK